MKNAYENVCDFMKIANQTVRDVPPEEPDGEPTIIEAEALMRLRFIMSEVSELAEAMQKKDIVETADALADICYVVIGTACTLGIPLPEVWEEVQRSNMAKFATCSDCGGLGGSSRLDCMSCDGNGKIVTTDGHGKVVKPEGWKPPDIAGVLKRTGEEMQKHEPRKMTVTVEGPVGCGKTLLLNDLERLGYKFKRLKPEPGHVERVQVIAKPERVRPPS